jgi:hypothetical protein
MIDPKKWFALMCAAQRRNEGPTGGSIAIWAVKGSFIQVSARIWNLPTMRQSRPLTSQQTRLT